MGGTEERWEGGWDGREGGREGGGREGGREGGLIYLSLIGRIKGCGRMENSFLSKVEQLRDIVQLFGRTLREEETVLK